MKVLSITSSFPVNEDSYEGGFILDLVRNLARGDITPIILAPHFPGGKKYECWGKIQVFRFRYFLPERFERLAYGSGFVYNIRKNFLVIAEVFPFFFAQFFSSLALIRKQKIDLVHSHWLVPQGLTGAILHRVCKIPHIATIHGSDLNLIKNNFLLRPICRFILRNSDSITVNSRFMKQQLLSVDPSCESKTTIIPMGVDPERFHGPRTSERKPGNQTGPLILSIGRLIDWKGTIFLIEAFPEVLRHFPGARLVIIGSGPEQEKLLNRITGLNLENSVRFLQDVSNEDLHSWYHSADVFVLPSINVRGRTEGLGVVLLEAMASGCPVIGSNVGGIPDIITDGETGFLVPEQRPDILAEKIIRIVSDESLRIRFRENGYKRLHESFSWDRVSEQFLRVYSRSGK